MRNTTVATLVAVCLISGSIGCKSAPKLAFWKSNDSASVESTALAHSAPSLPADVAKQAEAFASASPSIDISTASPASATASAPPYSPAPAYVPPATSVTASAPAAGSGSKAAPSAYPTTSAPAYASSAPAASSAKSPTMAAATPPALYNSDQSSDLGSFDMPYNPNAVPPAKTVAATTPNPATPTSPATNDRYGSSTVASTTYPATSAPAASFNPATSPTQPSSGSRYGSTMANVPPASPASVNLASSAAVAPAASSVAPTYTAPPVSSAPPVASSGDRYAAVAPPVNNPVTPTTPMSTAPPVSTAPAASTAPQVASAEAYRPGGTSSYEGLSVEKASVEIASRPTSTAGSVPNVAAPSSTTEPVEAPRYR